MRTSVINELIKWTLILMNWNLFWKLYLSSWNI